MKVYIMVGIPACGKSTYIEKNKNTYETIISSDSIREEITGDASNQLFNKEVFVEYENRLIKCLKNNKSCWLDSTAITKKLREKVIDLIIMYNKNATVVFVVFKPNILIALEQNKKRSRKVPEDIIKNMALRFEMVEKSELKSLKGSVIIKN
jgi:predicted kinase